MIVSTAKIYKHCLQTALASGGLPFPRSPVLLIAFKRKFLAPPRHTNIKRELKNWRV